MQNFSVKSIFILLKEILFFNKKSLKIIIHKYVFIRLKIDVDLPLPDFSQVLGYNSSTEMLVWLNSYKNPTLLPAKHSNREQAMN